MPDVCSSCGQQVRWARTAGGHLMLVNAELVPEGNLRLEPMRNGSRTPRVVVVPSAERVPGELLYVAHERTCPWGRR